jgi:hypothetical protein
MLLRLLNMDLSKEKEKERIIELEPSKRLETWA